MHSTHSKQSMFERSKWCLINKINFLKKLCLILKYHFSEHFQACCHVSSYMPCAALYFLSIYESVPIQVRFVRPFLPSAILPGKISLFFQIFSIFSTGFHFFTFFCVDALHLRTFSLK